MSLETLRLTCNSLHITSSGTRVVLANRLHRFYNPTQTESLDDSNRCNITTQRQNTTSMMEESYLPGAQTQQVITTTLQPNITNTSQSTNITTVVRQEVQRALASMFTSESILPTTTATPGTN